MYKVKITPYRKGLGSIMYRQTKSGNRMSLDGRYEFYVNEPVDSPDFWFVQGKGLSSAETSLVARENTVLLTTEPASVLKYPRSYIRQFGHVCTSQPSLRHSGKIVTPPILPWFVGYKRLGNSRYEITQDYDSLKESAPPAKPKLLSVITSNKAFTRGHVERLKFVARLKEHYGDSIDVFGHGIHSFNDKWEVLSPYKYHVVIENCSEPDYWTEKLGDCFLAGTFPLYAGCPNLTDYFPENSFEMIDIHDFDKTVAVIDRAIASGRYEQSSLALAQAKEMMLDEYNMFEYIARICDTLNPDASKSDVCLTPCKSMLERHNFWNYLVKRNYYKLLMKIRGDKWLK